MFYIYSTDKWDIFNQKMNNTSHLRVRARSDEKKHASKQHFLVLVVVLDVDKYGNIAANTFAPWYLWLIVQL